MNCSFICIAECNSGELCCPDSKMEDGQDIFLPVDDCKSGAWKQGARKAMSFPVPCSLHPRASFFPSLLHNRIAQFLHITSGSFVFERQLRALFCTPIHRGALFAGTRTKQSTRSHLHFRSVPFRSDVICCNQSARLNVRLPLLTLRPPLARSCAAQTAIFFQQYAVSFFVKS